MALLESQRSETPEEATSAGASAATKCWTEGYSAGAEGQTEEGYQELLPNV